MIAILTVPHKVHESIMKRSSVFSVVYLRWLLRSKVGEFLSVSVWCWNEARLHWTQV